MPGEDIEASALEFIEREKSNYDLYSSKGGDDTLNLGGSDKPASNNDDMLGVDDAE